MGFKTCYGLTPRMRYFVDEIPWPYYRHPSMLKPWEWTGFNKIIPQKLVGFTNHFRLEVPIFLKNQMGKPSPLHGLLQSIYCKGFGAMWLSRHGHQFSKAQMSRYRWRLRLWIVEAVASQKDLLNLLCLTCYPEDSKISSSSDSELHSSTSAKTSPWSGRTASGKVLRWRFKFFWNSVITSGNPRVLVVLESWHAWGRWRFLT